MDSVSFFPALLNMLFSLALVLGLLVGAVYLAKRIVQRTQAGRQGDEEAIQVLAARYVGPKSSIMLVEVPGSILVVGVTANNMCHLATISDPLLRERLKYQSRKDPSVPPLGEYFKRNKVVLRLLDRFRKDVS